MCVMPTLRTLPVVSEGIPLPVVDVVRSRKSSLSPSCPSVKLRSFPLFDSVTSRAGPVERGPSDPATVVSATLPRRLNGCLSRQKSIDWLPHRRRSETCPETICRPIQSAQSLRPESSVADRSDRQSLNSAQYRSQRVESHTASASRQRHAA